MAKYTDPQLVQIIKKAARRINRRLRLTGTTEEIVVDGTGEISSPDDSDLEDLVLLQAECLVALRDYQQELNDADGGALVVDGEQTVDTRQTATSRGTFFQTDNNPCDELKEALVLELLERSTGKMVW